MKRGIMCLILVFAFVCAVRAAEGNGYTPILYPSIFWHDNQWETYENGQWVPYRGSANNNAVVEAEPAEPSPVEEPQPTDLVDTNIYVPSYGWGFIGAPAIYPPHRYHHHLRTHPRAEHRRPVNGVGQSKMGLGKTTIGIGKPNVGIGRPMIGLGKPNVGIGQTTIGIGQPNVGVGRPNAGMGQPTIGIGQPNAGISRPNATIGQPNVGIGRTTIGIGQPMGSQQGR